MTNLKTIDAETLLSQPMRQPPFLVDGLLAPGLYILAGAPKMGKSWLTLWLCTRIASGKPIWKFAVRSSTVLYLCLEDNRQRIQNRLSEMVGSEPDDFSSLHFSTEAQMLTAPDRAADGTLVLIRSKRSESGAVLHCTGRDIQTRELTLEFNQDGRVWELRSDSAVDDPALSEEVLEHLLVWLREAGSFSGTVEELSTSLRQRCGILYPGNVLTRKIRNGAGELERYGFVCPNRRKCRDSSLHGETFLKENPEALFVYQQTVGFRPGSVEPDEGWLGEMANGIIQLGRSMERLDDIPTLPAPPTWTDSKQRRREALKKLAMGQKLTSDTHSQGMSM